MSVANAYLRMLQEAKKEEKLDPVGQEDGDIDNDGDKDKSDEYLAKRRKAIKKAMKEEKVECPQCKGDGCDHCDGKGYHEEAVEIDPENGEVTKMKKDKKSAKKGETEVQDTVKEDVMVEQAKGTAQYGVKPEDQEKLEPRAKGEKDFADKHEVDVVDRPDATKQDGAEKVKQAPARPGDNKQGDKLKTFKDIRK